MESEILGFAIDRINELRGISCTLLTVDHQQPDGSIDAEIAINHDDLELRFYVEVKRRIMPEQATRLLAQKSKVSPIVYFTQYITPRAREILRKQDIPYVDTAGNIFLNHKSLYINIQTEKTNREKLKTHTRAFNRAGLKVVYQFLIHPHYINKSYRFIGHHANVAIATVGNVLQDLLRERYLVRTNNKEYEFANKSGLFEEWVRAYSHVLKPKLRKRKYRWKDKNTNWKDIRLPDQTYWGGVSAAEILTDYLIADRIEIFTGITFQAVMQAMEILPDDNGEITLYETFWKDDTESRTVNPILVYADLIYDSSPRYVEAANRIYEEYVQDIL